jgi:ketosteroid isomerase-like protein
MTMPDAHQTLHGRDKVVQSYVAYTRMAETTRFTVLQANVDLFGDAAMVTTVFEMTYVLQEKTYKGAGRDIWLFKHSDGAWRGAWRSLADMYEEEE